ncbi:MAG: DUF1189 domain-containing protein [Candidatus Pacebacteria bacterium]|nr:DUF1189 domain-containing protein [Candidatus Paceibacterota bacterium]
MNFFKQIKSSIYDPKFYKDLEGETVFSSIKYFFKLSFFLALIFTIISGLFNLSFFSDTKKLINDSFSSIPEDLEINIYSDKGLIESNKKEPYFLNETAIINNNENIKKLNSSHILTVDTNQNLSVDALDKYNSIISVFKDSIAFHNSEDGDIRIYKAKDLPDLKISKDEVHKWRDTFLRFWPLIAVLINLIMFFILIIYSIKYLLGALVLGLVIFLLLKFEKKDISFKYSFKISLHLLTILIILDALMNSFTNYGFSFSNGYFSTAILALIIFLNLKNFKKEDKIDTGLPL